MEVTLLLQADIKQKNFLIADIQNMRVIQRVEQMTAETDSFVSCHENRGRGRRLYNSIEKSVLQSVNATSSISTRNFSSTHNVSTQTDRHILHNNRMHSYHIKRVQNILERDYVQRMNICQWLLECHAADQQFLSCILWSDESKFTRDGIVNVHNTHWWSDRNLHICRETHFQES